MEKKAAKVIKEIEDAFEKDWKTFPIYPIPDEHERHKIVAKNAYLAGAIYAFKSMGV